MFLPARIETETNHDTYTEELRTLIEKKAKGQKIRVDESEPSETKVVDLLEALEASLSGARPRARPSAKGQARKRPARTAGRSGGRRPAHKSA